jgi:uncharacterized protein YgiM (DUF1202 family)
LPVAEASMKSKIRINDDNNFREYNVRRAAFDTNLLVEIPHVSRYTDKAMRQQRVLLTSLLVCMLATTASAEIVSTNQSTKVYLRAGENSRVVLNVKSGQAMTVLAKDGRWVKVRVKGRTGYVTRTNVEDDRMDVPRNTRRRPFVDGRSSGRTMGGEGPDDRVGADATEDSQAEDSDGDVPKKSRKKPAADIDDSDDGINSAADNEDNPMAPSTSEDTDTRARVTVVEKVILRADPNKRAEKIMTATRGDSFFLVEQRGKWSLIETSDGDKSGWILTRLHRSSSSSTNGTRANVLTAQARVGFTLLSSGMRSAGSQVKYPDNYNLQSSSIKAGIGAEYLRPYRTDYILGIELAYAFSKASPGIAYKDAVTAVSTNISFTTHNATAVAQAGYDFHSSSGMALMARVGFHYGAFFVPTGNTATLPSEIFRGPVIGAALMLPQLTSTIGVKVKLDAIVLATRKQTIGVEDGATPKPSGLNFELLATYKWSPSLNILAGYQLDYASTNFGAPKVGSKRMHTGTSTSRSDVLHSVTIGAGKSF